MTDVSMSAKWERFLYELNIETKHFIADLQEWAAGLSVGEMTVGLCLFTLAIMYLIIRRPKNYKEGGGMGRQFVLALAIVVIFSFGASYFFDGTQFIKDNLF